MSDWVVESKFCNDLDSPCQAFLQEPWLLLDFSIQYPYTSYNDHGCSLCIHLLQKTCTVHLLCNALLRISNFHNVEIAWRFFLGARSCFLKLFMVLPVEEQCITRLFCYKGMNVLSEYRSTINTICKFLCHPPCNHFYFFLFLKIILLQSQFRYLIIT